MRIKKGVDFNGIQPETVMAMLVCETALDDMGHPFTATSILDGVHKPGSKHYAGLAFDIRTWADGSGTQLSNHIKQEMAARLRDILGPKWDVVVEDTHIHVEFDDK